MPNATPVSELFNMAIAAESAAQELYERLATLFASHPEVVGFWKQYAAEEAGHVTWLTHLRDRQSPEQLSAPADAGMLEIANRMMGLSVKDLLAQVHNLEDAYQLANELEGSETNAVCEFLLDNFSLDEKTHTFLRSQLRGHIARLMTDLPVQFRGVSARHAIKVTEQTE
jgi:rubrerythrin